MSNVVTMEEGRYKYEMRESEKESCWDGLELQVSV